MFIFDISNPIKKFTQTLKLMQIKENKKSAFPNCSSLFSLAIVYKYLESKWKKNSWHCLPLKLHALLLDLLMFTLEKHSRTKPYYTTSLLFPFKNLSRCTKQENHVSQLIELKMRNVAKDIAAVVAKTRSFRHRKCAKIMHLKQCWLLHITRLKINALVCIFEKNCKWRQWKVETLCKIK